MTPASDETMLEHQLLLDIFDLPVSFHRCLVPICGSVTAALLLSHAIGTTQEAEAGHFADSERDIVDGWFTLSQDQWTRETGLSRWEGMPARVWFKVDKAAIAQALQQQAQTNAARAKVARPP